MSDMVKFLHEEPVTTRIVSTLDQAAKINNLIDGVCLHFTTVDK